VVLLDRLHGGELLGDSPIAPPDATEMRQLKGTLGTHPELMWYLAPQETDIPRICWSWYGNSPSDSIVQWLVRAWTWHPPPDNQPIITGQPPMDVSKPDTWRLIYQVIQSAGTRVKPGQYYIRGRFLYLDPIFVSDGDLDNKLKALLKGNKIGRAHYGDSPRNHPFPHVESGGYLADLIYAIRNDRREMAFQCVPRRYLQLALELAAEMQKWSAFHGLVDVAFTDPTNLKPVTTLISSLTNKENGWCMAPQFKKLCSTIIEQLTSRKGEEIARLLKS